VTQNYKLKLLNDNQSVSKEFELTSDEIVIGREDSADLTIPAQAVSRQHAMLTRKGDAYEIKDLGSSNGTFVNGQKLSGSRLLKNGDQVKLGQITTLAYEAPVTESVTPGPVATVAQSVPSAVSGVAATTIGEEPLPSMVNAGPPKLLVAIAGEEPKTYTLTNQSISIGRVDGNDIVVPSQIVSGKHAKLVKAEGGYKIEQIPEAKNPVLIEGRPLQGSRLLRHGDILRIGSLDPGVMVTMTYDAPSQVAVGEQRDIVFDKGTLVQIGRDAGNDVVINSPNVSRFHAQVEKVGQRYRVEDLRSSNGTFVNDQRIEGSVWLKPEDTIRIGSYRFVMGKDQLASYDESNGLRVDAINLNKWVRKDLNILQNISVSFKPREFIVVVGQSGGGKSTFVDAVAGYRPATSPSRVLVNDVDIYQNFDAIRNDIGFVPQKDIIHMELTVYQALDYAAQLRMPGDTTPEEREKRVMEVLQDLDLMHRKDVQISGLSGGQQKRVSIGVELLTKPGLFFLDEPTSGLDPGTETALMQLMRRLADQGRTIVLITHATKNVMLADKVIFLARGGYLAWFGPPEEALEYFDKYRSERDRRAGKIEFDEIYAILDDSSKGSPDDWAKRYRESNAYQNYVARPLRDKMTPRGVPQASQPKSPAPAKTVNKVSGLKQFMILSARNIKILTRDKFALGLMLATAPVVSLLDLVLSAVLGRDTFDFYKGDMPNVLITLFLMTIYGVMVGGISQMREIVKEQDIYKRERLVNLKILPYVMSKIWVAALLAFYQAAVYTIVHYLAFKMPGGISEFIMIYITMTLATLAGMMLGLFASALAPNSSSAPLMVIILMLPQIVLGGALVPLPQFVSAPTSTRWAFEALMSITGPGSDVARDVCWQLPNDVQASMTLEDKLNNGCNCMGVNILKEASCNHPGLGKFYIEAVDQPLPEEPAPLPPEPAQPVQPQDQSDNVAMAEYFTKLQEYETQINEYKAQAELYQSEIVSYQTSRAELQVAVAPAEGTVRSFYDGIGYTYVDKKDTATYIGKVVGTWVVQFVIILVLFGAILFFQKRKDVI